MGKKTALFMDAGLEVARHLSGHDSRYVSEHLEGDDAKAASALTAEVFHRWGKITDEDYDRAVAPDGTLIDDPRIGEISEWFATFDRSKEPTHPENTHVGRVEREFGAAMVVAARLLHDGNETGPLDELLIPLKEIEGAQAQRLRRMPGYEIGEFSGLVKADRDVTSVPVIATMREVIKYTQDDEGVNRPSQLIFATGSSVAPQFTSYFGEQVIEPLTDVPLTREGVSGEHYAYVVDLNVALRRLIETRKETRGVREKVTRWVLQHYFKDVVPLSDTTRQDDRANGLIVPRRKPLESLTSRTTHARDHKSSDDSHQIN